MPSILQDNTAKIIYGRTITHCIRMGVCIDCLKSTANTFRDRLSVREYQISGLCQECQDKVFN